MYSILNKKAAFTSRSISSPATVFMISAMIVNGVNYMYNIWLGRKLGPVAFGEAGLLLTFLLVLSFAGMTFQLTTSKYVIELEQAQLPWFIKLTKKFAGVSGLIITVLIFSSAGWLQNFFHIQSVWSVIMFALTVPLYFVLSAERGFLQGRQKFTELSVSYQAEVWSKVISTVMLLYLIKEQTGLTIALSIGISVFVSRYFKKSDLETHQPVAISTPAGLTRKILLFAGFTLGYELVQILINYGDLLMVKHYYDDHTAGLYTSMSMIGRIIYFITWMLVMTVIPVILNRRKAGKRYKTLMLSYVLAITAVSGTVVLLSYIYADRAVGLLFGSEYLTLAPLLWKYALATTFFALANLLIYYFISTNLYWPVALAGLAIIIQLFLFTVWHENIDQIVNIQVYCMGALLVIQTIIYTIRESGY